MPPKKNSPNNNDNGNNGSNGNNGNNGSNGNNGNNGSNGNNVSRQKIYSKFGSDVNQLIIYSKAASMNAKVDCVYLESFIIGLLTIGENSVVSTLIDYDINLEECLKYFKESLAKRSTENSNEDPSTWFDLKISKQVHDICLDAYILSEELKSDVTTINHIFSSIMKSHPKIKEKIESFREKNSSKKFDQAIEDIKKNKKVKKQLVAEPAGSSSVKTAHSSGILQQFCVNMTEMASKNKFDPIIARENEIEEAITILCRRQKSNPVLVGPPGVGKSAIVEGIAQRIIGNSVPKKIQGCKLYSLNLTSMVAGTKYRGEFEERMIALIKEVESDPKIILFIDEIHTIMGAGSSGGGAMDAANILKPALARNMKCIGATTSKEYKSSFEEDGALMRRFGVINVEEPNEEHTKMILIGIKSRLEAYHECLITDDAIDTAIHLTKRYRADKFFPDKAIDCIDTACAKYAWNKNDEVSSITSNDIAMVISKQADIPLEVIMWDSFERIKKTEQILNEKIVGQHGAIKSICRILKNAYSGIRNPNRPIGNVIFGGQSGVGKTYTAKQLASVMFGSDTAFIRMDMTEYSESHSVSKIIGSPPGYVGFKDTDVVADRIKRKPYCVLLIDEVEKAHPTVMKLFLQIMGEGILTTSSGEKIDCRNTIIIMTGNFGMNTEAKQSLGFGAVQSSSHDSEKEKGRIISYCEKSFGVEFVNRIDDFIPFLPLDDENLKKIIKLRLSEFSSRIHDKNITIEFDDSVYSYLLSLTKKEHGMNAMIIERIISKNVESCIADSLITLNRRINSKYIVNVYVEDNEFKSKVL